MVNNQQTSSVKELGFTYMGVLFAVALLGVSLALIGSTWKTSQAREKEEELLFIGDQFRSAIAIYYERTPSQIKQYPKSFDQLIVDNRYLVAQRYLRKLYRDPMTNESAWGVVSSPDGGIMGVYSLSEKKPLKQANFLEKYAGFANSKHYSDWKFVYIPNLPTMPTKPK
jgi:type II secretory pathway pseudopilin PulG